MAHATITTLIIPRPVEVQGIALDLTLEEASFLVDLMGCIGGSPTHSRRAYADRIRAALRGADVPDMAARNSAGCAGDMDPLRCIAYFVAGTEEIK